MKQFCWIISLSFALIFMHASLTLAQEPRPTPTNEPIATTTPPPPTSGNKVANGSIRGTAYLDQNGDGRCVDTGEPIHPGVPIEFVSNDGQFTTFLATGDNGTYGLVAAAYGTWTVSARPNANDFVVTSATSQSVFISEEEPLALNIDFCIQEIDGPITVNTEIATFSPTTTTIFLPASGAAANNRPYYVALAAGLLLIIAGVVIRLKKHGFTILDGAKHK